MSAREREATKRTAARKTKARPANAKPPAPTTWRISSSGARFGLFAWKYLVQTKGKTAGRPLGLEPFEICVMSDLLQVEHEVWLELTDRDAREAIANPEKFWARIERWRLEEGSEIAGLRVHREGLLGIPKKNGKSTMSSGLALYLLIADGEPGAEIYSTASVKEQATIVFRQASEMVHASPRLLDHVRVMRSMIVLRSDGSFYKVVSADAGAQEGINPHGVINDEVHAHKTRELYDTLRSATIYREQPILFSITTAGVDVKNTIGGELYARGAGPKPVYIHEREAHQDVAVVKPRKDKQRSFYFRWYQASPEKAADKDPRKALAEIKAANPASWITADKLKEELEVPRPHSIFLRYHGNIWTRVEQHWLRPGAWDALAAWRGPHPETGELAAADRRAGEHEMRPGDMVVIGVDIGLWHDATAITVARPPRIGKFDDHEDPVAISSWITAVHPDPRDPRPDAHEVIEGDGPIRLSRVVEQILNVARTGYRVLAIAADPNKFETQLQEFEDAGFLAIRFDQTHARMVPASEGLYLGVANRLIAHDGDSYLAAHLDASTARDVGGGKWRLDKRDATYPMDAAISTAIAFALATNPEIVTYRRPSISVL